MAATPNVHCRSTLRTALATLAQKPVQIVSVAAHGVAVVSVAVPRRPRELEGRQQGSVIHDDSNDKSGREKN